MRKWFKGDYWLERLPLYRALLWILSVTLLISGTACLVIIYVKHLREVRTQSSKYAIASLVQECRGGIPLPTAYLEELLALSADRPFHLYNWNGVEGEKALKKSPYIKKAEIDKTPPETLVISYTSRTPVAVVGDFTQALIDREGYLLPVYPFIEVETLPTVHLGLDKVEWGTKLIAPEVTLAMEIKRILDQEFAQSNPSTIDVSRAYERSAGKRQVVIVLKPEGKTHILRLTSKNYLQQLANYRTLAASGKIDSFKSIIIDLRLDHLAYLDPLKTQGEDDEAVH